MNSDSSHLERVNTRFLSLPFWLRLIVAATVIAIVVVLTQSIQIFPGALMSISNDSRREPHTLPEGVESFFVETVDGQALETWRLRVDGAAKVAVIFHGNAGDVENFFGYQVYFREMGYTSYGFDYRGYGKSSGWPFTESGLNEDGRAVVKHVLDKEGVAPKDLVLVGISIGGGPAASAAVEFRPGALVLFSPFTSLPDAIKNTPLFGFLYPLSFYDFPVRSDVSMLGNTCLVVAHGKQDRIIPFEQGRLVSESYRGAGRSFFVPSEDAGHNDLFVRVYSAVSGAIGKCFE